MNNSMSYASSHARELPAMAKLRSFRMLPDGWHFGSGGAISLETFRKAKSVFDYLGLCGFTRRDVFVGGDREVLVTAYHRKDYVGVTIEPDGSASITFEKSNEDPQFIDCNDLREVRKNVLRISKKIWPTSDSSTQTTSIQIAANSMTWHSRNQAAEECRFSM